MSRGTAVGAGVGGVGILGLLLALLFGGALPQDTATPAAPAASSSSDVAVRCNQPGAIEQYDDCYIVKIFNETNEIWGQPGQQLPATHADPVRARRADHGWAGVQRHRPVSHCPGDNKVYIDLGFMKQLQRQLGSRGPQRPGLTSWPTRWATTSRTSPAQSVGPPTAAAEPRPGQRDQRAPGAAGRLLRRRSRGTAGQRPRQRPDHPAGTERGAQCSGRCRR